MTSLRDSTSSINPQNINAEINRRLSAAERPCPCKSCAALLRSKADPNEIRLAQLACKRRRCVTCRPYWMAAWLVLAMQNFTPCRKRLTLWQGLTGRPLRNACKRVRDSGRLYMAFKLADGTALVIASGKFGKQRREGNECRRISLSEALALVIYALDNSSLMGNKPVSTSSWWCKPKVQKSGVYEGVASGPAENARKTAQALKVGGAEVIGVREGPTSLTAVLRFPAGMPAEFRESIISCAILFLGKRKSGLIPKRYWKCSNSTLHPSTPP